MIKKLEAVIKIKFENKKEAVKACETLKESAVDDFKTKVEVKTNGGLLEVKIQTENIATLRAVVNSVIRDLKTIIEIKKILKANSKEF